MKLLVMCPTKITILSDLRGSQPTLTRPSGTAGFRSMNTRPAFGRPEVHSFFGIVCDQLGQVSLPVDIGSGALAVPSGFVISPIDSISLLSCSLRMRMKTSVDPEVPIRNSFLLLYWATSFVIFADIVPRNAPAIGSRTSPMRLNRFF